MDVDALIAQVGMPKKKVLSQLPPPLDHPPPAQKKQRKERDVLDDSERRKKVVTETKNAGNTADVDVPDSEVLALIAGQTSSGGVLSDEGTTFAHLGIVPALCNACAEMGYRRPTRIQEQSIPHALAGKDIIGLAETGSGKTAAFALPIIQDLLEKQTKVFALVLAPTRELAYQISEQFEALGALVGVKCCVVVGGMDMMAQSIALAKKPHVIVGTPGRIADHLQHTKGFSLRTIRYLVLDEADRLLAMDFETEITTILNALPRSPIRRTFLFSATMTTKVAKLQRASLTDPVKLEVGGGKYATVSTLTQQYVFVPFKLKDVYLTYILNDKVGQSVMVFTSTCATTQRVAIMLRQLGFGAVPLHGQMSQPKRLGALNKFKVGTASGARRLTSGSDGFGGGGLGVTGCTILIATDVAARGLDIPLVDCVINFDIPSHSKTYIHRVGRTARAGRAGTAITIVSQYDVELFQRIEHLITRKMDGYPAPQDAVMVLADRVSEAQRIAAMEMRELGMGKGGGDDVDGEVEAVLGTREKKGGHSRRGGDRDRKGHGQGKRRGGTR